MKFFHRELHSFADAQRNFEQLEGKDVLDKTAENFLQLLTAGTVQIAYGTGSFTGNGTASVAVTQAHGLGRSPGFAGGMVKDGNGFLVGAADATNLNLTAEANGALTWANATTFHFFWVAIG